MLQSNFLKKTSEILLPLFFIIFYINLIINDGITWQLNWILIFLFIITTFQYKKIFLPVPAALTIIIPFLGIYLTDFIFHSNQISVNKEFNDKSAYIINYNFLYLTPFLLLPSLLFFQKKADKNFIRILNFSIIISVLFNSYYNFKYSFDRGLLDTKLRPIILYDAAIASLSLLALSLNFSIKSRFSVLFILLALINLFLIIAHGTRGIWLGVPLILFIISAYYYNTELKKVVFTLFTSAIITILLFLIPNNPIEERFKSIKQDQILMSNNSYHSSIGTRLFLWQYSLKQFQESPIYGVGTKEFRDNICEQYQKGLIPDCQPHAHNIFLHFLATHGLLGFLAILSAFIIPFIFFIKSLINSTQTIKRNYSLSGIVITLFFGICGLTDFLFFTTFSTMFYFLTSITLMTIVSKNKTYEN